MNAVIRALDRPTVQEEDRERLLTVARQMVEAIESGDVIGMVCVTIAPDQEFKLYQSSSLRVYEMVGLMERIKRDMLRDVDDA